MSAADPLGTWPSDASLPVVLWDPNVSARRTRDDLEAEKRARVAVGLCGLCGAAPVSSWFYKYQTPRPPGLYVEGLQVRVGSDLVTVGARASPQSAADEALAPGSPFLSSVLRPRAHACSHCRGYGGQWVDRLVRLHSDLDHIWAETPSRQSKHDRRNPTAAPGSPHMSIATTLTGAFSRLACAEVEWVKRQCAGDQPVCQLWAGDSAPSDADRAIADFSTHESRLRLVDVSWAHDWSRCCTKYSGLAGRGEALDREEEHLFGYSSVFGDRLSEAVGLRAAMECVGGRAPRLQPIGEFVLTEGRSLPQRVQSLPPVLAAYADYWESLCVSCAPRLESLARSWAEGLARSAWRPR